MEVSSETSRADLTVKYSNISCFKQLFDNTLAEYDQQHQGNFFFYFFTIRNLFFHLIRLNELPLFFLGSQRQPWTKERILEVIGEIKNAKVTMNSGQRLAAMDYYWISKYEVMNTGNEEHLFLKRSSSTDPTVRVVAREQYFDILSNIHRSYGHGGRDEMINDFKNRYYIPKKAVEIFINLCPKCQTKKDVTKNVPKKRIPKKRAPKNPVPEKPVPKKNNVADLTVMPHFNKGQVDLIDLELCPDGDYKWLLNYQDITTKYTSLRPLKTKQTVEIASELIKIFLIFGAPYVLQSDNGREFTTEILVELAKMWPYCKIVHGKAKGSVEPSNRNVENMLRSWMKEKNSTNWSVGCFFVQYYKNASFKSVTKGSPYKALFGCEPKAGLYASDIPASLLSCIETEEELKILSKQQPRNISNQISSKIIKTNNITSVAAKKDYANTFENSDISEQPGEIRQNEATGVHKCKICNNDRFSLCFKCKNEQDMQFETMEALKGLKRAAEEIIDMDVGKRLI